MVAGTAAILAVATAVALPPSASALGPDAVEVAITDVQPLSPKPGDTLVISGTVRNATSVPLRDVAVRLRVGGQPLSDADQLVRVGLTDEGPADIVGSSVTQTQGFVSLDVGKSSSFTLRVPTDTALQGAGGVYGLAAEAVDGATALLGAESTLVPWTPAPAPGAATPVSLLWPLTSAPARDAADVVVQPSAATDVAPGGRLTELLRAGESARERLTWVVDPQTLQTAAIVSKPYSVLGDGAQVATVPAEPGAAQWLSDLRSTLAVGDVRALPYAYPDTVSQTSAGLTSDVVLATATSPALLSDLLGRPVTAGLPWAPGGSLDQPTLNILRAAGAREVVIAATGMTAGDSDYAASPALVDLSADSGPITGAVTDPVLTLALGSMSADSPSPVRGRQLAFAAVALAAGAGTPLVAAPQPLWQPDEQAAATLVAGLAGAPYARLTTLRDLLAATPERPPAALAQRETDQGLNPAQLAGIGNGEQMLSALGAVMTSPAGTLTSGKEAMLRSASTAWRSEPTPGGVVLLRSLAEIGAQRDLLTISSTGTVAFPGEEGKVPITVSNGLDVSVQVGVALSAEPSYRLTSAPVTGIAIPPGQRLSLEVPVRVVGSQPLQVTAQLLTPQGANYGSGTEFALRTSAYSRVAAWLVGGALVMLVLMVVVSVVRRVRGRGRQSMAQAAGDERSGDG